MLNPVKIKFRNGEEVEYWYDKNSCLHREEGPAVITHLPNGNKLEKWYWHGKLHRRNGPAVKEYEKDGRLIYKAWYRNGKLYRKDGPTEMFYDPETEKLMLAYYYIRNNIKEINYRKLKK
ncbi:hypothetical protein SAMN04324257_00152 [Thermoanaerobacter thermohydrosulfuricus]|nr:hypothetical protein SAMN04324257_00152 [Thermoanaerobacter thermohydrosulfuricus]